MADVQTPELMSEDQRREKQRQVWEQQELENAAKRDIHYQDVLFNGEYPTGYSLPSAVRT